MISTRHKFIFVHIPKTGGNSVQSVLAPYSDDTIISKQPYHDGVERFGVHNTELGITAKHAPLRVYRRAISHEQFRSFVKFATVRNPWDRMISSYFSPHRGHDTFDRDVFIQLVMKSKPLPDFCDARTVPRWMRRFLPPRIDLDCVVRFENLQSDFDCICDKIGIPRTPLPHRNQSSRTHYSKYYDDELISLVGEKHAFEIREFDYHFEYRE